jgi:hypothetical protein
MDTKPLPPPSLEMRRDVTLLVSVPRTYVHLILSRWSEQRKEIATAVMLRAGNHLFALTAEHCVRAREEMRLFFPLGEGQKPSSGILKELTREPLDIAVLELEDRPDVLGCEIEQVCIDLPAPASADADPATVPVFWVIGYPAKLAQASDTTLTAPQIAFGTNLVGAKPDVFALYYHDEAYGIGQDLTCKNSRLPETPVGFSGAGVWGVVPPEGGTLFNPQKHIRLYGIQYAWLDQSRLLKCVPSRIIVEMLVENYPDLKDRLLNLFPTLSQPPAKPTE